MFVFQKHAAAAMLPAVVPVRTVDLIWSVISGHQIAFVQSKIPGRSAAYIRQLYFMITGV
jgi:hypothetical protein